MKIGIIGAGDVRDWNDFNGWVMRSLSSEMGVHDCYSDMTDGVCLKFAEIALNMEHNLVCVYPYKAEHKAELKELEDNAAVIVYVNKEWNNTSITVRDRYIVNSCDLLLAVPDGKGYGKVYNMMQLARELGKDVYVYEG